MKERLTKKEPEKEISGPTDKLHKTELTNLSQQVVKLSFLITAIVTACGVFQVVTMKHIICQVATLLKRVFGMKNT